VRAERLVQPATEAPEEKVSREGEENVRLSALAPAETMATALAETGSGDFGPGRVVCLRTGLPAHTAAVAW
jgi:hypothetical protein